MLHSCGCRLRCCHAVALAREAAALPPLPLPPQAGPSASTRAGAGARSDEGLKAVVAAYEAKQVWGWAGRVHCVLAKGEVLH